MKAEKRKMTVLMMKMNLGLRSILKFTFTYNVIVLDDNRIEIDLETVKFGEGPCDPATGVCEFKVAPEFYEVFTTAKKDDNTQRFTFSRKGDKIQLEGIVVGKDEDSATIGIID